jgi:hypothetical protein
MPPGESHCPPSKQDLHLPKGTVTDASLDQQRTFARGAGEGEALKEPGHHQHHLLLRKLVPSTLAPPRSIGQVGVLAEGPQLPPSFLRSIHGQWTNEKH